MRGLSPFTPHHHLPHPSHPLTSPLLTISHHPASCLSLAASRYERGNYLVLCTFIYFPAHNYCFLALQIWQFVCVSFETIKGVLASFVVHLYQCIPAYGVCDRVFRRSIRCIVQRLAHAALTTQLWNDLQVWDYLYSTIYSIVNYIVKSNIYIYIYTHMVE